MILHKFISCSSHFRSSRVFPSRSFRFYLASRKTCFRLQIYYFLTFSLPSSSSAPRNEIILVFCCARCSVVHEIENWIRLGSGGERGKGKTFMTCLKAHLGALILERFSRRRLEGGMIISKDFNLMIVTKLQTVTSHPTLQLLLQFSAMTRRKNVSTIASTFYTFFFYLDSSLSSAVNWSRNGGVSVAGGKLCKSAPKVVKNFAILARPSASLRDTFNAWQKQKGHPKKLLKQF